MPRGETERERERVSAKYLWWRRQETLGFDAKATPSPRRGSSKLLVQYTIRTYYILLYSVLYRYPDLELVWATTFFHQDALSGRKSWKIWL
jgi:hypothetical protein